MLSKNAAVVPAAFFCGKWLATVSTSDGMRCRCGFDVALYKQRGPVDGVFKSLVPGPSGDWSI